MTGEWINTLIAVAGTLSAVVITAVSTQRSLEAQQDKAHRREQERTGIAMVAAVVKALDEHRVAMWTLEEQRHAAGGKARAKDVARSKRTRGAVSDPLTSLQMFVSSLDDAAQAAADATYAMRGSKSLKDLKARRRTALTAVKELKAVAKAQFKAAGIGLVLPREGPAINVENNVG
ncbi:MAG: hypothetical protein QOF58_1141 [Pseudonocardiales bacterium]|nr:hypothetical protein [Pseudonocardiales bacterium]